MAQSADPGEYPYVFVDGVWLKRSWGGEVRNVSVLVAVGVDAEGCFGHDKLLSIKGLSREGSHEITYPCIERS